MRRFGIAMLTLALITVTTHGDHHKEKKGKAWLDLENCVICQPMGQRMDMMAEVTWENHKIANGSLSASVVPAKYKGVMDKLHDQMKMTAEKVMKSGDLSKCCGFCTSYGELQAAGAKSEEIKTEFGVISLLTSDDPELVKKIHAHTDKTNAEFAKMVEAESQAESNKPQRQETPTLQVSPK